MADDTLTDREMRILAFEARNIRPAIKEDAIHKEFKIRETRYYQLLNALIERPAALAYDPQLVRRLLNARERRMRARAANTFS